MQAKHKIRPRGRSGLDECKDFQSLEAGRLGDQVVLTRKQRGNAVLASAAGCRRSRLTRGPARRDHSNSTYRRVCGIADDASERARRLLSETHHRRDQDADQRQIAANQHHVAHDGMLGDWPTTFPAPTRARDAQYFLESLFTTCAPVSAYPRGHGTARRLKKEG